jgi:hypothetical protein
MKKIQGVTRRFVLLLGPGGYMTCVHANSPWRHERYRSWDTLCVIHRPLSLALVQQAQCWAVRQYHV